MLTCVLLNDFNKKNIPEYLFIVVQLQVLRCMAFSLIFKLCLD